MAKTFGIQPLFAWWNVVPGVAQTAFYRYAPPTWELAFIVLSAFGIDALDIRAVRSSGPVLSAVAALVVGAGFLLTYGAKLWPQIGSVPGLNAWALISVDWSLTAAMAATLLLANNRRRWKVYTISGILMFDSSLLFIIPTLSNVRGGQVDRPAIAFLQRNIGLQRFYTLGPIQPNYGAYFRIGSINHNYLPVPELWVNWVHSRVGRRRRPGDVYGDLSSVPRSAEHRGRIATPS